MKLLCARDFENTSAGKPPLKIKFPGAVIDKTQINNFYTGCKIAISRSQLIESLPLEKLRLTSLNTRWMSGTLPSTSKYLESLLGENFESFLAWLASRGVKLASKKLFFARWPVINIHDPKYPPHHNKYQSVAKLKTFWKNKSLGWGTTDVSDDSGTSRAPSSFSAHRPISSLTPFWKQQQQKRERERSMTA